MSRKPTNRTRTRHPSDRGLVIPSVAAGIRRSVAGMCFCLIAVAGGSYPAAAQAENAISEEVPLPFDPGDSEIELDPDLSVEDSKLASASSQSVEADIVESDTLKSAVFPMDEAGAQRSVYYRFRDKVRKKIGLDFTTDYSFLFQNATDTLSGEDNAGSQVFRFLGTWLNIGEKTGTHGRLVWKFEYRGSYGDLPTPRDMGFDTGSVLSTANYKQLGWGITDLYWRQYFAGDTVALNIGHMDPGDWTDQFPHLNAWTRYLNDGYYNNPSQSIPKRGFGFVAQYFMTDKLYLMAGVNDANGKDGQLDPASFFQTREWMTWVEFGYRGDHTLNTNHNIHTTLWHQDERKEAGVGESKGITFTYCYVTEGLFEPFIRIGVSDGDAPQMRRFAGLGTAVNLTDKTTLGLATSWGSPPQTDLRDQITTEVFYRVQLTQHISLTPDLQVYYQPSYNPDKDWITVIGLRMRFTL